MSIMLAALNPRISSDDLVKLIERDTENKLKVIETFKESFDKLETKEQRQRFVSTALPVLISFVFI